MDLMKRTEIKPQKLCDLSGLCGLKILPTHGIEN